MVCLRSFLINQMTSFTQHTLSNGIPLVHIRRATSSAEYIGVIIDAGSRDENLRQHGLAHFVEHTIFKGTSQRTSIDILNTMEEIGGELNAYTTKEDTTIYTVAPKGYAHRSLDLLSDLIANASFPDEELSKERQVVADEIDSYMDIPSEAIFDDFEDLLFKGSSLGHNILGTSKSVGTFSSRTCNNWIKTFFTTDRMAAVYLGPECADKIISLAEETIGQICRASSAHCDHSRVKPSHNPRFSKTRLIDSHQAHIVVGTTAPSLNDPDRFTWSLVTNMLGGPGMNSYLNIALREQRGLVYNVEASTTTMTDTGLFTIYLGCDPGDTMQCLDVVGNVISDLSLNPPSGIRMEKARTQLAGQITVASDSSLDIALSAARSLLRHGSVMTSAERIRIMNGISTDDIVRCAESIKLGLLSMLIMR